MLAAFVGGAAVGWTTHKFDSIELARQRAASEGYKAQVADQDRAAEQKAREALQAQIDQRHAVDRNNEEVMSDLRKRTADAESHYSADRAFIHSLLDSASKNPTAKSDPVPEGQGGSGTAPAGGSVSSQAMAEQLCADTKAEDERNANRLDALIAEVTKQVEP